MFYGVLSKFYWSSGLVLNATQVLASSRRRLELKTCFETGGNTSVGLLILDS